MSDKIFILKSKDGKPLKLDTAVSYLPLLKQDFGENIGGNFKYMD